MAIVTLDLAGLKCPLPALRTRKALAGLKAGDQLLVYCTDPMAAIDIPHLVHHTGYRMTEFTRTNDGLKFLISVLPI